MMLVLRRVGRVIARVSHFVGRFILIPLLKRVMTESGVWAV